MAINCSECGFMEYSHANGRALKPQRQPDGTVAVVPCLTFVPPKNPDPEVFA